MRSLPRFIGYFLAFALTPVIGFGQTRPDSRDLRFSKIPRDFQVGAVVAQRMERHFGLVKDKKLQNRVRDLGYRCAATSGHQSPFIFNVLDMGDPNAVALPGGFIYVTRGLLELDLSDDELAHVLAHECGHVIRKHHKRIKKSAGLISLIHAAVVTGAIIASQGSSQRSTTSLGRDPYNPTPTGRSQQIATAAVLSGVASHLFLLRFIRDYELEADRTGRILATGAGFSPQGSEAMLGKLLSRSYERPGMGILRTHPYLKDRMEIARGQAGVLNSNPQPRDALPYRNGVQEVLHYRAVEYWNFGHRNTARFLLRNAYEGSPRGALADDSKVQALAWLELGQGEQSHRNRDYGFFCHSYRQILQEFPNSNLKEQVEQKLKYFTQRRDDEYPNHLRHLDREKIIPSFGEYFLRNYPGDPRTCEARYKLAEGYRMGRKYNDSAELFIKLLEGDVGPELKEKAHASFPLLLPKLKKVKFAYQYFKLLKDEQRQRQTLEEIRKLVTKSEDFEDLGQFREDHPKSKIEPELVVRLTELSKNTLAKARFFRKTRNYSDAAFEYYKISRYSPDKELARLANEEIKEMQELE